MRESAVPSIPAASKKIVQSLKEIVNGVPDNEIYAALKDCNMDPNEAVSKLLSQDPFRQVKSKRDKRKETKENTEVRSRGGNGTSNRGRVGADHDVGRRMSTKRSSSDFGLTRGNPAYKNDYGNDAIPESRSSSTSTANNINCSVPISSESKLCTTGMSDGIISSKPSQGVQPTWVGIPGHVSMADVVKMGRPHAKTPTIPNTASSHSSHSAAISNLALQNVEDNFPPITSSDLHRSIHSSHVPTAKFPDGQKSVTQSLSSNSGPLGQQLPDASGPSLCETSAASVTNINPSSDFCDDEDNSHSDSGTDAVQVTEDAVAVQNQELDPAPQSDIHIQLDNSGHLIFAEDSSIKSSYQFQRPGFERQEGSSHPSIPDYLCASVQDANEAVTSAVTGLQQLSLQKEESNAPVLRENRAVIIPNHLQVPTADCPHLSFGSFSSGISASFTGSFASNTLKSNLDDASGAANDSSVEHLETRSTEDYGNEHVSLSNENLGSSSPTQPVILSHDTTVEAINGHQYPFPSSLPNYAIGSSSQTNATGYCSGINSQLQNPVPFSSVMTSTNASPSDFLASAVQPVRDTDFPYSPFTIPQSTSMRYESGMSSTTGPIVSVPEVMKPNALTSQPNPQTLPSISIPMATALPQHLAMHHVSQPPLFANMVPYSFLQRYPFMPSAFQQPYAASTVYHQSPATAQSAGMKYSLPQYKNSIPASSLPQAATVASVYGNIGSSTNIPGSFLLNPSTAPSSTAIGYGDALGSQFKYTGNYGSPQQNEASTLWVNGPGSRTMSVHPASTYYSYQAQNQQSAMRQSQQLSHYGALGYPNFYHSQALGSQERQQLRSDVTTNASQGTPSQQSHQIWQQSY